MSDAIYTMSEPPRYSLTCKCGITISGNSERGLSSLYKRHQKDGVIHMKYKFDKVMIDDISEKESDNA